MAPPDCGLDAWEKTIEESIDTLDINRLQRHVEREPMRIVPVKESWKPNPMASGKPNKPTYLQQVLVAQKEAARLQLEAAKKYHAKKSDQANLDQRRRPKGWNAKRQYSSSSSESIPRP